MSSDLRKLYESIALDEKNRKRDITSSSIDIIKKSNPKSPVVLDYEAELFGLSPEEVKRLPLKSVEMLQQALHHLIAKTKEDPVLRQALRKMINNEFSKAEEDANEDGIPDSEQEGEADESVDEAVKLTDEGILGAYRQFLASLTEAKAMKFNFKMLNDIEPGKITNPFFVQLLTTFGLLETTRQQRQGVLMFLKKLAELAGANNQIAQALNRIVRIEATQEQPVAEEGLTEEQENMLMENVFSTTMTPNSLLADLGIPKAKANEFAEVLGFADWDALVSSHAKDSGKFANVIQNSVKKSGGVKKFAEMIVKAKISNSIVDKLMKKLATEI